MTSDPETTSPVLPEMNDEITRITNKHKRQSGDRLWRRDHKTDPTKLWGTIKAIDDKSTPKAENEAIVQFYSKQHRTTSLLDDTDSTRNLYQQRYWT